jgi:hypothetical protein
VSYILFTKTQGTVDWNSSQTHSLLMYSGVFGFGLASSGFSFVVVGCGFVEFVWDGLHWFLVMGHCWVFIGRLKHCGPWLMLLFTATVYFSLFFFLQGRYIVSKALQFVQDRDKFLTSEHVHKSHETFFSLFFSKILI